MARIPRSSRTVLPSGRVAGGQIPSDIADTGQGLEARALGQLGGAIGQLGQTLLKITEAEGNSQFRTAMNASSSDIDNFGVELQTDANPTGYSDKLNDRIKDIQQFRPTNSIGAKKFDEWIASQTPVWEAGVNNLARRKVVQIGQGAHVTNLAGAIARGDEEQANFFNDGALVDGFITNKEHAKTKLSIPTDIAVNSITTSLNGASALFSQDNLAAAAVSVAQAEVKLDSIKLTPDKERVLRSRINTSEKQIKTAIDQARKDEVEQTTTKTVAEMFRGTLSEAELEIRHNAGEIKDDDYLDMVEKFNLPAPVVSNVFSRSLVGRAVTDFQAGAGTRQDMEKVFVDNYQDLSIIDRNKFMDKIETEFVQAQQASLSEAKRDGVAILDPRFKDVDPLDFAAQLETTEDATRFELQTQVRNLYEDAIDDWVAKQTADGKDVSPLNIRERKAQYLIQYRDIAKLPTNELERAISGRLTGDRIRTAPIQKTKTLQELQTETVRQLQPIEGQSKEELLAERDRLLKAKQ